MLYPSATTYPGSTAFPESGYAPQLTVYADADPAPRVEVLFRAVLPSVAAMTVYRLADGRTMPVRGGVLKAAVGGLSVIDFEVPFGINVTYRAEMFADLAGTMSLGFSDSATTLVDVTDSWIHQPLDPSLAFSPIRLQGTAATLTRKAPGNLVYPMGAEVGTWIGSQRQGLSAVPFDLLTDTAGADMFQRALSAYGSSQVAVLCFRTPPPMRLPRVFFGAVSQLDELEADIPNGGDAVEFTFTADEAAPPAPGLVVTLLSRDDIDAAYPTRAARAAAYLTRLDRDRDYSLAGSAG